MICLDLWKSKDLALFVKHNIVEFVLRRMSKEIGPGNNEAELTVILNWLHGNHPSSSFKRNLTRWKKRIYCYRHWNNEYPPSTLNLLHLHGRRIKALESNSPTKSLCAERKAVPWLRVRILFFVNSFSLLFLFIISSSLPFVRCRFWIIL